MTRTCRREFLKVEELVVEKEKTSTAQRRFADFEAREVHMWSTMLKDLLISTSPS